MIDRTKPPAVNDFVKFKMPDYEEVILDNGLSLFLIEDKTQALAAFQIIVNNGAYFEKTAGTNALTAMMLTRGTEKMKSQDISLAVESHGATLKMSPGFDEMTVSAGSLSEHFVKILDISSDCFFNSTFDKSEFDKSYIKNKSSILQENADISFLSQYLLAKAYYNKTGYSKPISGTLKSIKNINRDMVYENYLTNIQNNPSCLIFAGNFDRNSIIDYINDSFLKINISSEKDENRKISFRPDFIAAINKAESNQAVLRLARPVISREHPDYPYIQLINTIFGGFFMSRLNHILREDKGYTYGIHSVIDNRKKLSTNVIVSSVNIDKAADSIEIIKDSVRKLREEPITEDELTRAVGYSSGAFLRSTETVNQKAVLIKNLYASELNRDYYETIYNKMTNAQLSDIHRVVEEHFCDDQFVITAAGDLSKIRPQLEKFGNVEIFEIEE